MVENFLVFDEIDSRDYQIIVQEPIVYNTAKRRFNKFSINGRDGDLYLEDGSKENVQISYKIVGKDINLFEEFLDKINRTFCYCKLYDSFHLDFFRMGVMSFEVKPSVIGYKRVALATLTFDCDPNKYLNSGLEPITLSNTSATVTNPTPNPCYPLLRVYGYGTVTIGGNKLTIEKYNNSWVEIDCKTLSCKYLNFDRWKYITFNSIAPIQLGPNSNRITYSLTENSTGSGAYVVVTPRWYK